MSSGPVEVVFSISQASNQAASDQATIFHYTSGATRAPGPWKRGRPKGSLVSKPIRVDDYSMNL